jgi:hypothetical protein
LGDFRRKRNRALIPIFCRNQKDFHGNPRDIATATTTDKESALPDWFEAKNFSRYSPISIHESVTTGFIPPQKALDKEKIFLKRRNKNAA